jgi:hypothetical protein
MSAKTVELLHTQESWEYEVLRAIRGLGYGSVEVTLHAGRVVQIERREKVRLDEAGRRQSEDRRRNGNESGRVDRTTGATAMGACPGVEE